jgi:alcohol dehydrogenase class IV
LGQYGIASSDLDTIVDKAAQASSMKGNPIPLTRPDLLEILKSAL